jgi:hypothetical protein
MFLNCSTCFGRQTAHHQEFKNCSCSLWFYIRFCLPAAAMAQPSCAIKRHWNNKFYYTLASCWFFLWDLYYDARIHEHQEHSYSTREFAGFCTWLTNLYHRAVSGSRLQYWWQTVSTYIPRFWINNTDATHFILFRCRTTSLFLFLSSFLHLFSFWSLFQA